MKHVRAIVSNQAHLTGDTHKDIALRYNIPSAKVLCEIEYQRAQDQQSSLQDWMFDEQWQIHLWCRIRYVTERAEHTAEQARWACPACDGIFPTQAALKWHARRMHNIIDTDVVFNKALHSKGGLPVCRFCDAAFSRWQTLADHITKRRCQKLPASIEQAGENLFHHMAPHCAPPPEPERVEDKIQQPDTRIMTALHQSLMQETKVQQHAARGINAFIQLPHVLQQLKQHCALCGQWVASHRTMKRHYQYSHKDVLEQYGDRIDKQVRRVATACPTCHYCHARTKDWKAHLHKCVVAWQCSVLCLIIQDGTRRTGGVLRHGQATGDAEQAPPISRATDVASAQPSPQRRLGAYFGKSSSTAGRRAENLETRSFDRHVDEAGRSQHIESSVSGCESVQAKAAGKSHVEPGPKNSENSAGDCRVSRTCRQVEQSAQQRGAAQEGLGHGMERSKHGVAVSTLEPHPKVLGEGPAPSSAVRSNNSANIDGSAAVPGCGHRDEVRMHSQAHRDNAGNGHVPHGHISAEPGGTGELEQHLKPAGQHGPAADRAGVQEGNTPMWAHGEPAQGDDSWSLRLVLGNRGNHCYMNAFVQVVSWLLDRDEGHFALIGRSKPFFKGLSTRTASSPLYLCNQFLWRNLIQQWPNHNRQHDVAEFSAFFIQRHDLSLFQGHWATRCQREETISIVDSGCTTQPLLLHFPDSAANDTSVEVQSLLDAWAVTAVTCSAFTVPPPVLLVQLARFRTHSGKVFKRHDAVTWGEQLRVPLFLDDGLATTTVSYRLQALITHIGHTPRTGHYIATCVQTNRYWSCDDGRRAVQIGETGSTHAQNLYLLAYQRLEL